MEKQTLQEDNSKEKFPSELRYDIVSRDWVVIATGRAKRPEMFKTQRKTMEVPTSECPFCNLKDQEKPTVVFSHGKKVENSFSSDWTTLSFPNKYPAFIPSVHLNRRTEGELYQVLNAIGFHEVVITKDHKKQLADLSLAEVKEVFDVYQERYLSLMKEKFVSHISIFHNHGAEAGASIAHPHSQIITTPLIDPDLERALQTAQRFYRKNKKCIYCAMLEWERKAKTRIIFENNDFIALCPFASKVAFEVIISPKHHSPYFEKIGEAEKKTLAEAFQAALGKLSRGLSDPAYNFYLHTAPPGKKTSSYHWHWTILPKTATWAGFEIGTRMEISTIEPEKAAEFLRGQ